MDVKNGRVVKGTNFVDLKDAGDPVAVAEEYNKNGADELCFLDIAASQENRKTTYEIVQRTAEKCFMPLTVGGGVRNVLDVETLLRSGADKVSFNSTAVSNPDVISLAANKFGNQCIVVAIDAKLSSSLDTWEVFTHGGTRGTGIKVIEFAKEMEKRGAGEILLTSMDKDGTREGYDLELTKSIASRASVPVIASGGVGKVEHLLQGIKEGKASAVLAASIFHYKQISIQEAKKFLNDANIPVRLL